MAFRDPYLPMSAQPPSQIVLRGQLPELGRLSQWVADVSEAQQLPARLASHVDLCLTELVTNAIIHGYAKIIAPPDAIIVKFLRQSTGITWRIEDHGIAFDPSTQALPALPTSLEDAPIGGSGLRLVRKFADQLEYHRENGTNHMTVFFSC